MTPDEFAVKMRRAGRILQVVFISIAFLVFGVGLPYGMLIASIFEAHPFTGLLIPGIVFAIVFGGMEIAIGLSVFYDYLTEHHTWPTPRIIWNGIADPIKEITS